MAAIKVVKTLKNQFKTSFLAIQGIVARCKKVASVAKNLIALVIPDSVASPIV